MPSKRKPARRRRRFPVRTPVLLGILALILLAPTAVMGVSFQLEDSDSFCASCHSQPEATYYQRSLASPVDLATVHRQKDGTRCIDCHAGSGLNGRIGAFLVGSGDLLRWVTRTARQPAPIVYPIRDDNCLKCHAATPATQDFNRHFHAFLARWQAIDSTAAGCVDCHTAHTTDGDPTIGYLQQQRTVAVCQRCHDTLNQ